MTLDQLRYFQAVCKYNSVSRASEHLNISQPSVSNAISKLEAEFGTMPFTRQNKRLILTKEGIMLLELANNLLLNADHALQTMKELSDNKTLNLGVPPMLSSFILPILYRDFFKNYPILESTSLKTTVPVSFGCLMSIKSIWPSYRMTGQ